MGNILYLKMVRSVGVAIRNGRADIVEQLLDEGLNPNSKDDIDRSTPILIAAVNLRKPEIVRLLLDRGADPNIRLPGGETALFTPYPNQDIVDMLLDHGADVDIKNNIGETALFHFVYLGNAARIKLLVSRGADLNATDNEGKTPLMRARTSTIVELLLRLGADPDIRDNSGYKASDYASSRDKKIILQMAEKRFSKKIFPSEHGRITSDWMEICNTLGNAGVYDLKNLIAYNTPKRNFDFVAQFFTSSSFNDVDEFLDYIQGLSKREICAGLAKYYTVVKPAFLSEAVKRGSVRPISEMARKSIQSKRRKASLYSLAFRKARQTDPEKFREYISQFALPNP
jgi:ankyrin repeat protein